MKTIIYFLPNVVDSDLKSQKSENVEDMVGGAVNDGGRYICPIKSQSKTEEATTNF